MQTTAVRLALRYILVYAVVLGIALAAFRWSTGRYVDAQLEADLQLELATLSRAFEDGGSTHLAAAITRRLEDPGETGGIYLLVARDDEVLAGNLLKWPEDASIPFDGEVHSAWVEEEAIPGDLYGDDAWWPLIAREFPDGSRLLLARHIEQAEELSEITEYLLAVLSAAMALALMLGITVGRTILGRMDTISRTAGDIMAGDLSQRVPVSRRNDEFDALAGRLNKMLDRIQRLIRGIREVTDNTAHDLRSPLTRLRNRLEITLLEHRSEEEYRDSISQAIEDTESLIRTFNALLGIAQAEAGNHRTQWGPVELGRLAADLVDLYRPAAEDKGQTLEFGAREDLAISGSRDLLAQAIGNLLENAIKYTPPGGTIRLQVKPSAGGNEVIVSDTGPGIPGSEREHVLERFVRLEGSRHTPGNGLGLSLVQAVAVLHNAELHLGDAGPGLVVTLRFPQHRPE